MRLFADEQRHTRHIIGEVQRPGHLEAAGDQIEGGGKLMPQDDKVQHIPFDAHEEHPGFRIDVLVEVQDVAPVGEDEIGHGGDQSALVDTRDQ